MPVTTEKVFSRERFTTQKEWLYFCLEFDLQLCWGCQERAHRIPRGGQAAEVDQAWYCDSCSPSLHPALWEALRTGKDQTTTCGLCGDRVGLRDCWISEDAQRLYCSRHLEPIRPADRLGFTVGYLEGTTRPPLRDDRLRRLRNHLATAGCRGCAFNGRAIYAGDRIVEIDRGERSCDCAPDTLNCAGIEH